MAKESAPHNTVLVVVVRYEYFVLGAKTLFWTGVYLGGGSAKINPVQNNV